MRERLGNLLKSVLELCGVFLFLGAAIVVALVFCFFARWAAAEVGIDVSMPSAGARKPMCREFHNSYWMVYETQGEDGWAYGGEMSAEDYPEACPEK